MTVSLSTDERGMLFDLFAEIAAYTLMETTLDVEILRDAEAAGVDVIDAVEIGQLISQHVDRLMEDNPPVFDTTEFGRRMLEHGVTCPNCSATFSISE